MKSPLLLLLALCPASANICLGSVGVIYFTSEKIVVAADSRVIRPDKTHSDDECKIGALGGKVAFVSAGMSRLDQINPLVPGWSNLDLAHDAYKRVVSRYSTPFGHLVDFANDFAMSLYSHWTAAVNFDRLRFFQHFQRGALTEALLGGIGTNGLELIYVRFEFDPTHIDDPIVYYGTLATCADHQHFCAIGRPRIAFEFVDGNTDRAVADSKNWKPGRSVSKADLDLQKTMHLVHLTIKYDQTQTVGGPIDALQLNKNGELRWYQRKNKCLVD